MDFTYKILNRNKRRSLIEVLYTPDDARAIPKTEMLRYSAKALEQASNPTVYIHRFIVRRAPMDTWDREVSLKTSIERDVTQEEYDTITGGAS